MGCGTGPLRASNAYQVTLTFDTGSIAANDAIYTHFQSALDFLLEGLGAVGASGYSSPQIIGGNVTSISVEVDGPLGSVDAVNFNRAFNRLTPATMRAINRAVIQSAVQLGLEDGKQLRVDTTVVVATSCYTSLSL